MVKSKYFPGYSWLESEDKLKQGDIIVGYDKALELPCHPRVSGQTVTALEAGMLPWQVTRAWGQAIYRLTAGPVRLPLNPIHSEPVPLP